MSDGSEHTTTPISTSARGARRAMADFKARGRIVIVGASLAGLRAAETLRDEGFSGALTLIGDEPHQPYDRPPLSKQVATGWVSAERTTLPRRRPLEDVEWRLGVPAVHLNRADKEVHLADGEVVAFDRLLITTGVRARPWPNDTEAALDGVLTIRTREDGERLRERLASRPRRVLVIGGGFTGSEVASVCREIGLEVTVAERGPAPLAGALGGAVGRIATEMQLQHGVDLRCGVTVEALDGNAGGQLRQAQLSDGSAVDTDLAVVALGTIRNTDWLRDSGLAAGPLGVACDAGCRAMDLSGVVSDDIFVAGDVARFPHPVYEYQLLAIEHWSNALIQSETAAHNMVNQEAARRPHLALPSFWSIQFGVNIKSVGVPTFGEQVTFVQGSVPERRFVVAYGHHGRIVAAVTFNQARWVEFYEAEIASAAPFPGDLRNFDQPTAALPLPAEFPSPTQATPPMIMLTGHTPSELQIRRIRAAGEPR
jgi:NADPH-dependent 2,4-dienoyl-CoA reductase/sulfur reductase-like enzyme